MATREAAARALCALDLRARLLFVLCGAHGFSVGEAARLLRIPEGTAKTCIRSGRLASRVSGDAVLTERKSVRRLPGDLEGVASQRPPRAAGTNQAMVATGLADVEAVDAGPARA